MSDFGTDLRPQKNSWRNELVNRAPDDIKTALLLPSDTCLDIIALQEAGKLNKNCRLFIAETDPVKFDRIEHVLTMRGLGTNIAYRHLGKIEELDDHILPHELNLVNYDLCGCFSLESFNWLHKIIRPRINGLFSMTFLKSYRRNIEFCDMFEYLKNMPKQPNVFDYNTFHESFTCQYNETKVLQETVSNLDEKKLEYDLIERYITQNHYILSMVFSSLKKPIYHASYADTQSQMCIWFMDTADPRIAQPYIDGKLANYPDFTTFYNDISKIMQATPIPQTKPLSLIDLINQYIELKNKHHQEEINMLQNIRNAIT